MVLWATGVGEGGGMNVMSFEQGIKRTCSLVQVITFKIIKDKNMFLSLLLYPLAKVTTPSSGWISFGVSHASDFGLKTSVIGLFCDLHWIVSGYDWTSLSKAFDTYTMSSYPLC